MQNTLCWDGPKTVVSQILRSIHSDFVSTFSPAPIQIEITMIDFKGSQTQKVSSSYMQYSSTSVMLFPIDNLAQILTAFGTVSRQRLMD